MLDPNVSGSVALILVTILVSICLGVVMWLPIILIVRWFIRRNRNNSVETARLYQEQVAAQERETQAHEAWLASLPPKQRAAYKRSEKKKKEKERKLSEGASSRSSDSWEKEMKRQEALLDEAYRRYGHDGSRRSFRMEQEAEEKEREEKEGD